MILLTTVKFAFLIAFILGIALGFFKDFFAVQEDPVIESIRNVLPGANCGACGYPGCDNFAAEVSAGRAKANSCTVGGSSVVEAIAAITGVTGGAVLQAMPVLLCQGTKNLAPVMGNYTGAETCRGAKITGGIKLCYWGCVGYGDCVSVCKFDAITMKDGLPVVDYTKCTGCLMCIAECPMELLKGIPKNQKGAMTLCSNVNPVKPMVAKSCKIACFKCGLCVRSCPEKCISLETNIPVIDSERCNSCGICAEKCPNMVLKIIEKDIFPGL